MGRADFSAFPGLTVSDQQQMTRVHLRNWEGTVIELRLILQSEVPNGEKIKTKNLTPYI